MRIRLKVLILAIVVLGLVAAGIGDSVPLRHRNREDFSHHEAPVTPMATVSLTIWKSKDSLTILRRSNSKSGTDCQVFSTGLRTPCNGRRTRMRTRMEWKRRRL